MQRCSRHREQVYWCETVTELQITTDMCADEWSWWRHVCFTDSIAASQIVSSQLDVASTIITLASLHIYDFMIIPILSRYWVCKSLSWKWSCVLYSGYLRPSKCLMFVLSTRVMLTVKPTRCMYLRSINNMMFHNKLINIIKIHSISIMIKLYSSQVTRHDSTWVSLA